MNLRSAAKAVAQYEIHQQPGGLVGYELQIIRKELIDNLRAALAQPDQSVVVITGDGEQLMGIVLAVF